MSSSAGASRRPGPAGRAAAALVLGLALLSAGARGLAAQEGAIVERVIVRVDGRPGAAGLLGLIPIRSGDGFSARLVDRGVKQIFSTGLFADVRVTMSGEERVELVFDLVRNVFIDAVRFEGVKVPAARLRESLTAQRPGAYLQEDRLPDAVEEVKRGLRQEGYFDAIVKVDVRKDEEASTASLVFRAHDWATYRVGGLEVEWKAEIPEGTLLGKMKTRVGDIYVPARLAADLRALSQGLTRSGYVRAEVRLAGETFDEENRRVDLQVEIVPNEKIAIAINGARVPVRIVEPIWEERVFEPWGLAEGEARILSHLRRRGYLFATVQSRIEKDGDEMRVVHDVTTGPKTKIAGVEFRGQSFVSGVDLKTRLAIREGVPLFSLLGYDRLFSIPREVENFYKENGFADIRVRLDLVRVERGVEAVFIIEEGARTTVDGIRIEGASLIPPETLVRELISREGGPYFPPNVQKDVSQIEMSYLNEGLRGSEVVGQVERAPNGRLTLVYEIKEGTRVTIQDIFIAGNRLTRNRIIRRELRIAKGDKADYTRVQESERRLENLGIFSEVRLEEVQTGPADEVVVVTVREGEMNYTGLGLGFESLSRVSGSLADWPNEFRPRGIGEYIRSNIFGLGAQVGVLGQISTIERRAVVSWNQPYLLGLSMPTTLLAWAEREARESFTLDRRGVSLNMVKALSRSRLLLGSLSLTRTSLKDVDLDNPPEDIDRQFLPYSAALASLSMSWERRDDTLNPERGHFFSAVGELGLPVFGTESDYQKVFLKYQRYQPLSSGLNLGLTGRLGLGNGLRYLPERFFAGGSNTFRGEEFELLGPLDPVTLKPYGGEAVLLVNADLTFALVPSWRELRVSSFFDLGNVYPTLDEFRPFDLQGAAGAGIRYRTPLGPVRLEIAWKLWGFDAQDKKGRPLVFLTIGNIF
ncbi:MAG: BamA/TamA family outer membrane protein [Candidatus Aminicenantes bacterium]|nr:BamA/TamA family outer membrane protein [Candidatus Aminicenantes bacterium]